MSSKWVRVGSGTVHTPSPDDPGLGKQASMRHLLLRVVFILVLYLTPYGNNILADGTQSDECDEARRFRSKQAPVGDSSQGIPARSILAPDRSSRCGGVGLTLLALSPLYGVETLTCLCELASTGIVVGVGVHTCAFAPLVPDILVHHLYSD